MIASHRQGFTAIEMMVSLIVLLALSSVTVPSLVGALRHARVNEAANAVSKAIGVARSLARTRQADAAKFYGVVIVNDQEPAWVGVTYGVTATKDDLLLEKGKPVCRLAFNRNVVVFQGASPLPESLGFFFKYRLGHPIATPSATAKPTTIAGLSLRTLDDAYRAALAIYEVGMINIEFE